MSRAFARVLSEPMAMCRACGHDLSVRPNGTVYCTNDRCKNRLVDYMLGKDVNTGHRGS